MKIWIDITNTPHVNVLMPIMRHLERNHELIVTARDFSETIPLLKNNGIYPIIIGEYKGKSRFKKVLGLLERTIEMRKKIPEFDIGFSLGGNYTSTISWLRGKPSIVFSDNDISFKVPAFKFGTDFIFPKYFDSSKMSNKYNIASDRINKFDGFKEDIYIASFKPDPEFLEQLPFRDFITIRPENLKASYVPQDAKTIVPDLFKTLSDQNILFLPRYEEERKYAEGYNNVFMPEGPLSGLDVCFYTKAMLTGAGTFAREAALLGTPSVSFYPGHVFLTVDQIMQEKGWEFKSRDADEIKKYLNIAEKKKSQINRSLIVQKEVLSIVDRILNKYVDK